MKKHDQQQPGRLALVVILTLCLTTAGILSAQRPAVPPDVRYAVVAAGNSESLQAALNDLSSAGLQVFLGSFDGVFFTRLQAPDQPGAYRALRDNTPDRLERALNAAGEQSFRLLPATLTRSDTATVAVSYRAASSATPFRYRVVRSDDDLARNLSQLALKGFSIAGVFTQQSGITATVMGRPGRLHVVLEAPGGAAASSVQTPQASQYRVVSALRASTMYEELNEAASEGYRVVGGSFMNVLLEKPPGNPTRYSYRVVGAIRGATVQREVEEAAREGFRVIPAAIMGNPNSKAETVIVMERASPAVRRYGYHWVSAPTLARPGGLDDQITAGFTPVALWRFDLMIEDEFGNLPPPDASRYAVLLEKEM